MLRIPFIVAKWITIVCSGVHAVSPNASRLNAVDFMQHRPKHPDGLQWIPCIVIECSVLHAAWSNASRLNAEDSMQRGPMDLERMQWNPCSVVQWILIERSGFDASLCNVSQLNAVEDRKSTRLNSSHS